MPSLLNIPILLTLTFASFSSRAGTTVARYCTNKIATKLERHPEEVKTVETQSESLRVTWKVHGVEFILENYFLDPDQMWSQPVIGQNLTETHGTLAAQKHSTKLFSVDARGKVRILDSFENLSEATNADIREVWKMDEDGTRTLISTVRPLDGDLEGVKSTQIDFPVSDKWESGIKIVSLQTICSDYEVSESIWEKGPGKIFENYVSQFDEAIGRGSDLNELKKIWDKLVVQRDLERLPLARERRRVIAERAALARRHAAEERARRLEARRHHATPVTGVRRYRYPRATGTVSPETRRKLDCITLRMTGDAAVPGLGGIAVGLSPYCNPR